MKNKIAIFLLLMSLATSNLFAESNMYFVHNDHLGTPKVLTDSNQTIVWQVDSKPFGETDTLVDSISGFPVGFPGQYSDSGTGYIYNYYRDYDPSIGRYVQSDPIGLDGGLNTYGYVMQNPLIYSDPLGLAHSMEGNHSTGQWKECKRGCRIRIDYTIENGRKRRHLHWECRNGQEGVGGEYGGVSHGTSLAGAPKHIKECARQYGFEPDPSDNSEFSMECPVGDGNCQMVAQTVVVGGLSYVIYRCIRMAPSLAPPLWWSIGPNLAVP